MLPRKHRLTQTSSFTQIQSRGQKFIGQICIIRVRRSAIGQPVKVGFSVSEKVGKAVERNRVKRRMREAIRSLLGRMNDSWDVVIIARPSVRDVAFSHIVDEFEFALGRLGVIGNSLDRPAKR